MLKLEHMPRQTFRAPSWLTSHPIISLLIPSEACRNAGLWLAGSFPAAANAAGDHLRRIGWRHALNGRLQWRIKFSQLIQCIWLSFNSSIGKGRFQQTVCLTAGYLRPSHSWLYYMTAFGLICRNNVLILASQCAKYSIYIPQFRAIMYYFELSHFLQKY